MCVAGKQARLRVKYSRYGSLLPEKCRKSLNSQFLNQQIVTRTILVETKVQKMQEF